ncbi:MAG: radical SAM protein [Microthrixaceae bacterium]|nr:radical SAM protein [Microthrixaceae bacterium]
MNPAAGSAVAIEMPRAGARLPAEAPVGFDRWSGLDRARRTTRLAGFFGLLTLKEHVAPRLHVRPLVAELFLTENCNLRCRSCGCWTTTTRGELRTDEWCNVIDQLADLGILKVNFTGGEPLVRRDAVGLVAYAANRGIRDIHLNTNAIHLDPGMLTRILAAGVRSFNISVDGPDAATHDEIRGVEGSFETTIRHLQGVIEQRDRYKLAVRMNFTVMRSNARVLPEIARLAQRLGVRLYLNLATDTTFLFRTDLVTGEAQVDRDELRSALEEVNAMARMDRRWLPAHADLRYVIDHFEDRLQATLPCAESQLKLMIHSQGQVGGCWGHDPSMSVREQSLRTIVDSTEYRDEHERFFRKECVGCGSNYSLNLRWRPASLMHNSLERLRATGGRSRQ